MGLVDLLTAYKVTSPLPVTYLAIQAHPPMYLIELLTAYKVSSPLPITYVAIPAHLLVYLFNGHKPDSCVPELHLGT